MEARVKEALGELDLKVTNVEELSKKVKMFQSKCSELEEKLSLVSDANAGEVQRLAREKAFLEEKN